MSELQKAVSKDFLFTGLKSIAFQTNVNLCFNNKTLHVSADGKQSSDHSLQK